MYNSFLLLDKIWLPSLEFQTTPKLAMTQRDKFLVVEVQTGNGIIEDDISEIHEELIHKGSRNELKSRRIYNEIFECEYSLQHFPFDQQLCHMTFALALQQASLATLVPNCQGLIPITSDIQQANASNNFFHFLLINCFVSFKKGIENQ